MSKIGRKPIDLGSAKIEVKNQDIHIAGKKNTEVYRLPKELTAEVVDQKIKIYPKDEFKDAQDINGVWGLHRALLANRIKGIQQDFEKVLQINGLGYKAAVSGKKVKFSLGFSHPINYDLPENVSMEVDKTGQRLVVRSADKEILGQVCSEIRSLRPPEPYKGTGIKYDNEVIARKAGKTKA